MSELADATGLSVRVLRHWDQLGLVIPERSAGGHRCYRDDDVRRLYRVLALREMGLPLRDVAALLAGTDPSPRATLEAHLERVESGTLISVVDEGARRPIRIGSGRPKHPEPGRDGTAVARRDVGVSGASAGVYGGALDRARARG